MLPLTFGKTFKIQRVMDRVKFEKAGKIIAEMDNFTELEKRIPQMYFIGFYDKNGEEIAGIDTKSYAFNEIKSLMISYYKNRIDGLKKEFERL